ncbi:MAG TPA: FAD-dependent oxidoreductase [Candidatus Dormibacteraeota bacterium]|nr:FAD-dependent oxidoreductase [Candidatus Dormibacteraeota bacterium]
MPSYPLVPPSPSTARRSVDVAVVGAGAIGLAVAVQLRRRGVERVLVIDAAAAPGAGSTSRANGGVRAQFSTRINVMFSQHTIRELMALDESSGGLVGYRSCGYLLLCGSERTVELQREAFELQRSLGVPVRWLDPDEVRSHTPFVRVDGLRGATFCATDGVIDPHGVVSALHREGMRLDVAYAFDAQVREITRGSGAVRVSGDGLEVECEWVVNAAGAHAAEIAAMAELALPVVPRRRNLVCTEHVPGFPRTAPMCVDVDTGVLIRPEGDGVLVGYTPRNGPVTFDTAFEPAFLEEIATRIGNRFPFLAHVPVNQRKCWAGLYPETPDHHAIIDAVPEQPWFIQCAGFGGHGIMHSMAAGSAVAELITDGGCSTFDLAPLRLGRFDGAQLDDERAVF